MEIDHREKITAIVVAMKKRSRVFTIFPETFFLFFKTFFRCYGLWVQLTTLQMATGIKAFTS